MALILSALYGLFLSAVGAAFILSPRSAVQIFGIDPTHLADIALSPIAGARELALGLVIVVLAIAREQRAAGLALVVSMVVPVMDFVLASRLIGPEVAWRHLVVAAVALMLGLLVLRQAPARAS